VAVVASGELMQSKNPEKNPDVRREKQAHRLKKGNNDAS
jgi:hypothetical protein